MSTIQSFQSEGFSLKRKAFQKSAITDIQDELLKIGNTLAPPEQFSDLDSLWNFHRENDRERASAIYNGFKYLASIKRLATSVAMTQHLKNLCGIQLPALIDVNCRIDSSGEEKYLFNWHQDYWFSVCSPQAVVAWIPVAPLSPPIGGLEIISNTHTGGRIFKTTNGGQYHSYADAVMLDEDLPLAPSMRIDEMEQGDALFFGFNTLHKSLPIRSENQSRFTVQLRFADYTDPEFINAKYRPGTVNSKAVDYMKKENQ